MQLKVDLGSMSISKSNTDTSSLSKYDIDASIDEIENNDELSKMKFSFTTLSESKSVRLGIDGQIQITGSEEEREAILKNGQDGIPELVHMIYSQLYPEFFMLTKSVNVPCPPHTISKLSTIKDEEIVNSEQATNTDSTEQAVNAESTEQAENKIDEKIKNADDTLIKEETKTIPNMPEDDKKTLLEDMTLEQLEIQHKQLTEDYNKNPKNDTLMEITKISKLIENKQKSK